MKRPPPPPDPLANLDIERLLDMLLDGYARGCFPMAELPDERHDATIPMAESIALYSPDPRAIISLDDGGLHIGRTLARTLRKANFTITSDRAFGHVMTACALPGATRGGAWIDQILIHLYTLLHQRGHAHSLEAWSPEGLLMGGVYGVSLGKAFFAESMFSSIEHGGSGASSACLVALWNHLRTCGYSLLDVQMANEHTLRFGVQEISRSDYLGRLADALIEPVSCWKPLDGMV